MKLDGKFYVMLHTGIYINLIFPPALKACSRF